MASGLNVPVGVSKSGGASIVSDETQTAKILRLALAQGEDDNPFQNLGLPADVIFSLSDPSSVGLLRNRIQRILAKLSDRVRLKGDLQFYQTEEGVLGVFFEYYDLELGTTSQFSGSI